MRTNRLSAVLSVSVILVAVSLFTACKGGSKTAEQDQLAADSLNKTLLATEVKEVLYPLPTPLR